MAAQQAGQCRRQQTARNAAGHINAQLAHGLAHTRLEHQLHVLGLGQQRAGARQQLRAVGRQVDLTRGSVQQPRADLGLQLLHGRRHRGTRQLQRMGGLDEAAHLCHLHEDAIPVDSVHGKTA